MRQLTKKQAIAFNKNKLWKNLTDRQRAEFQIEQELLCMPFKIWQEAMEKTLGRGVYTHEFALNLEGLKAELYKDKQAPTFEEILALIPKEMQKIILIID